MEVRSFRIVESRLLGCATKTLSFPFSWLLCLAGCYLRELVWSLATTVLILALAQERTLVAVGSHYLQQ